MSSNLTVQVSSKYQIVIPQEAREKLDIKPGDRFVAYVTSNSIEFVRVRPIEEYRGLLPGIDSNVERDDEDRV